MQGLHSVTEILCYKLGFESLKGLSRTESLHWSLVAFVKYRVLFCQDMLVSSAIILHVR